MGSHAKKRIYLDYAAATPVDTRVVDAMEPFWNKLYGNPSALHEEGRRAREAVEGARASISSILHCKFDELIFTSGGTESNNHAIFGAVEPDDIAGAHLVTSIIEHPSVLDCFALLEKRGARVTYIGVRQSGEVDLDELEAALTKETALVSIMFANNEIGTRQPIEKIATRVRKQAPHALFHTDAAQAPVYYELDVEQLGVDMLTIDGQKMYGPKGVGALYVRSGVTLAPLLYGGKQERGQRPGTENVPGIVGLARAYEIAEEERSEDVQRITELRDYFVTAVQETIPSSVVNGEYTNGLPNIANISFENVEGEFLVLQLDAEGIACATRSACFGAGGEGSPVIAALDKTRANNAVRFSLGRQTTKEDIAYTVEMLKQKLNT